MVNNPRRITISFIENIDSLMFDIKLIVPIMENLSDERVEKIIKAFHKLVNQGPGGYKMNHKNVTPENCLEIISILSETPDERLNDTFLQVFSCIDFYASHDSSKARINTLRTLAGFSTEKFNIALKIMTKKVLIHVNSEIIDSLSNAPDELLLNFERSQKSVY